MIAGGMKTPPSVACSKFRKEPCAGVLPALASVRVGLPIIIPSAACGAVIGRLFVACSHRAKAAAGRHNIRSLQYMATSTSQGDTTEDNLFASPPRLVWVTFESEEPQAVMDLLLGLGAFSASARPCKNSKGEISTEVLRATPNEDVPLWRKSIISALFDAEADLTRVAKLVCSALDLPTPPTFHLEALEERDWVAHVQKNWDPLLLAAGFEVRLPWHGGSHGGSRNANGRVVIQLEGGAAFGLGDHPTTQGAVSFLERTISPLVDGASRPRVLDYGTGSGVLSICAALLGAGTVVGVDVDRQSIESARRSAGLNLPPSAPPGGTTVCLHFREGPVDFHDASAFASALAEELGPFDIVVANILCRSLVALAPALAAAARPGAMLALSGLRSELGDFEAIAAAYQTAFTSFREVQLDGGWLLIEAQRR